MLTTVTDTRKFPKYMQKINLIIATLSEEPNMTWTRSQRELCDVLHISQPELSNLINLLINNDKIIKGEHVPGMRGRSHVLILKDPTPFDEVIPRVTPLVGFRPEDRVVEPLEEVMGMTDLRQLDTKMVGQAVLDVLKEAWESKNRNLEIRTEQNARLREYRDQLHKERQIRMHLADERDQLLQQIETLTNEKTEVRGQLNKELIKNGNEYPVQDILDEESRRTLDTLMRTKPGHYRESDADLGI